MKDKADLKHDYRVHRIQKNKLKH